MIKRSYNDFDVIQITKVNPLPPIPKYTFDKKGTHDAASDSNPASADRSSRKGGDIGKPAEPIADKRPKPPKAEPEASKFHKADYGGKSEAGGYKAPVVKAKAQESGGSVGEEAQVKIDEEQKKTGCQCALL